MEDQGIDFHRTLASFSCKDIIEIFDVLRRTHGLVNRRMHDKGNPISVLLAKNFKLTLFLFNMMKKRLQVL